MTRDEIIEKLKTILKYTVSNPEELLSNLTEESNLYTDLSLSSVGMLYIIIAIEETFKIKFENVNFEDFQTVKDVIDYISKEIEK